MLFWAMIKTLFPTSIYEKTLSRNWRALNRDLKKECLKFAEVDLEGQEWSQENYPGGYTSYGSISQMHQASSTFDDLRKHLDQHRTQFVRHLEMDIDPRELQMTRCWINVMPSQVQHSFHLHPLSVLSGTYYVQTPKNCAAIKFEDPRIGSFMASPPRKVKAKPANQMYPQIQPKEGNLILFESWLKHEVPANKSRQDRISISFNYDWV
jgi:uncharacterized protein (TIGR02466 family)